MAAAHRNIDVGKVLRYLHSSDESFLRVILQRLHVGWYRCKVEGLLSFLRPIGPPAKVCNLVA